MNIPTHIQAIDGRLHNRVASAPWSSHIDLERDGYVLLGPDGEEIGIINRLKPHAPTTTEFFVHARQDMAVLLHEVHRQARRIEELEQALQRQKKNGTDVLGLFSLN